MQIDWNPVLHILDALSEGTHSLLELSYMAPSYDRVAFVDGLVFLAERGLVELSAGRGPFEPIPKSEWPTLLRECFSVADFDQQVMVNRSIDLSQRGEQVLNLFGIGHP
jgi:hypothetical protein